MELARSCERIDAQDERAVKNDGWGITVGGRYITRQYLDKVIPFVTEALKVQGSSNAKVFPLMRLLRQLDHGKIALVTLRSALSSVAAADTLRDACLRIGKTLSFECWAAKLTMTDRQLAQKIAKSVKLRHSSLAYRRRAAEKIAEDNGFSMRHWDRVRQLHAGHWAIQVIIAALPDIFELIELSKGERQLVVTPKAIKMAEDAIYEAVNRHPAYQPLTEPVSPWDGFTKPVVAGIPDVQLMRTHHKDIISAARYAIQTGQMAPALSALNSLQAVPFKINTWLLDVINQVYKKDLRVAGVPMVNGLPEPHRLPDAVFAKLSKAQRELRRRESNGIKLVNRMNVGDQVQYFHDMETAERLAAHDAFYTPMNMDWRGRVYGITHFNFQREDRVRALFLFANGEPIGERGLYWLKVHTANCGAYKVDVVQADGTREKVGIDKRPIEERVKWVDDNITTLTGYVDHPLINTGWMKADSPFLFLAACREIISALSHGPAYVTNLPVSFDGSCSGLQHLAAMTRAPEGAFVNLTNNTEPQDIYQLVADMAKASIEEDTENEAVAKQCLDYGVTRTLVKRNVMTFAYSSKVYGMGHQHLEDTMEPLKLQVLKGELESHPFGDDEGYAASKYLARHVHAAIVRLVQRPAQAMGFMQSLARTLAHEGKPLRWTTPAGLPWINRYHEVDTQRIELWLNDHGVPTRTQVTLATGYKPKISKDKAASGVSPNFVHACDASHLLLTTNACIAEGIVNIATVHDSFGCLPSQAERFNAIIREQFLKLYTDHDVLAELLASAKADLTEASHHKLPELPEQGALDLTEIIHARYAFA
jgi:DNA-directed RNA polymerase